MIVGGTMLPEMEAFAPLSSSVDHGVEYAPTSLYVLLAFS